MTTEKKHAAEWRPPTQSAIDAVRDLTDDQLVDLAYGTSADLGRAARVRLNAIRMALRDPAEQQDFSDWLLTQDMNRRAIAGQHGPWIYGDET